VVVLEAHENERAHRIVVLCRAFVHAATAAGARNYIYDRETIAAALDIPARSSRYEVACRVAGLLPELSHRTGRSIGRARPYRKSLRKSRNGFANGSLAKEWRKAALIAFLPTDELP